MKFRPLLYLIALSSAMLFADDPVNPIVDECGLDLDVPTYVQVNDDDDDDDKQKDLNQTEIEVENDLKPVTIVGTASSNSATTMHLTISNNSDKLGYVFWSDAKKTTILFPPLSWDIAANTSRIETVYAEGVANSDTIDDIEIEASIDCKPDPVKKVMTSYLLDIRDLKRDTNLSLLDADGGSISATVTHAAIVGIKDKYIAKVTPNLNEKEYLWSVDSTDVIKTYEHDVLIEDVTKHKIINLVEADKKIEKFKFFWTKSKEDAQIKATVSALGVSLNKTIRTSATYSIQPSAEIYAIVAQNIDPTNDTNPNGGTAIYYSNDEHSDWHLAHDGNGNWKIMLANYTGKDFMDWHWNTLNVYKKWCTTFNYPTNFPTAESTPATPAYFTTAGSQQTDLIFGYVRLDEFLDRDEIGHSCARDWHGVGHNAIPDNVMKSHLTSMGAKDNNFWDWHTTIETVCQPVAARMKATCTPTPSVNSQITLANYINNNKKITIAFSKFVSDANVVKLRSNTAGIKLGLIKINNIDVLATWYSMDIANKKCTLTVPEPGAQGSPLIMGTNTVEITSTRTIDQLTFTFELIN